MADVNINKFRASVVRDGSKPASPGFIVSEGQDPVDPAGNGQNHLPVTISTAATGLSITDSQVLGGAGTVGQYIRGDGSLADFPQASGGGSSVSYYLNGSISQGTIGGVAYKELNKVPILGAGTDFTINADGYIASFLTDAGDPNLLEIPGGNWNFETYFSASSSGGTPSFYVELYKYDGTTFTLIASSSSSPELIAFGTNLNPYFSTLAVPTTTLALTDRLAVRYYVTHSGRTITLHTENNHLCQVVTTFTTGLTSLNGLTAQVQNLAVGTSGTDFNIASATATHTFNLPTASATNRGALSSADWTTFNNKQNALGYVPVPETRTITINGVSQDLSANRTYNVGTVTSVGLSSATSGVTIGGSPVTTSGTITLAIATASGSQNGLLSSTDWTTFNNKQNALTNPVTGTGTTNYLPKFTGSTTIGNSNLINDASGNLGLGITPTNVSNYIRLQISGTTGGIFDLLSGSTRHFTIYNDSSSSIIGTVTNTPLIFQTNDGTKMTLTSSGNLGLGVTPSAWSGRTAIQLPDAGYIVTSGASLLLGANVYFNGSNRTYISTAVATDYRQINGEHRWEVAPSGTAGNTISFTQAMTLFSTGNLLVGSPSPISDNGARLQVSASGGYFNVDTNGQIISAQSLDVATAGGRLTGMSSRGALGAIHIEQTTTGANGGYIAFRTSDAGSTTPTEKMRIASTGAATFSSSVTANGNYATIAANTSTAPQYYLTQTGGNTYSTIGINRADGTGIAAGIGSALVIRSGDATDFPIQFATANNVRVTIATSGNVGIGTSSPTHKLQILGGPDSGIRLTDSSGNTRALLNPSGAQHGEFSLYNSSGNITTYLGGPGSGVNYVMAQGGNFLIGTTTDNGSKLQVAGNLISATLLVRNESNSQAIVGIGNKSWWTGGASDNDAAIGTYSPNMCFFTNNSGTERMRITSDNNVLFNTTSTGTTNSSSFIFRSGTGAYSGVMIMNHATTNNTGAGFIDCYYNTSYIGGIVQNGASNISFLTSSDYRLKEDLKDFDGLSLILGLKVYDFKWKTEDSRMYGVLAHELQEVVPYTVSGDKDEIKENGKIKVQAIDYSKLVPLLIKAIQEQQVQIQELKNKLL